MPHLQLDVSGLIPETCCLQSALDRLVNEFCRFDTIFPNSVKAYARIADYWSMGEGAPPNFIHLTICVLAGRAPSLLHQISDSLHLCLRQIFHKVLEMEGASVTLEIRQMESETYRK